MTDKAIARLLGVYAIIAVVCFGPATAQSERAKAEHIAQCKADRAGDAESVRWCAIGGPNASDGLPKAIFWPLWLSYMAATR